MATEKRLIPESERANLIRCLKKLHDIDFTPGVYEHSVIGRAALLLEETVDAAPVVHGEWNEGYTWNIAREKIECYAIDCSECENTFKTKTEEDREYWKKRFKVCPFCGAIMDGERGTDK